MIHEFVHPSLTATAELIKSKRSICLLNPNKPDGDSIGSALSLYRALESLGKDVRLFCPVQISDKYDFIYGQEHFKDDLKRALDVDLLVSFDFAEIDGFDITRSDLDARQLQLINIDHHITNTHFGDLNFVDPSSSACCEMVYYLIRELELDIDIEIATALFTGLSTDTGSFKHSNTTPRVLSVASNLLARGARLKRISDDIYQTKSVASLKMWGKALERLKFEPDRSLAVSFITQDDFDETGADLNDLEGAISLLSCIPGSRATLLLSEYSGKIKGSIRTEEEEVDVSRLAGQFSGGGHKKASGFTLDGRIVRQRAGWKIVLN
jgi:phosphoesterase RecJ-like protein